MKKDRGGAGREGELLDRLARESGTAMLSDLHGYISRGKIYDAVCGISSEEYSLKEWEEAAGYILGGKTPYFQSARAARRYLCNCLSRV